MAEFAEEHDVRQTLNLAATSWIALSVLSLAFAIPVAAGIAVFVDPLFQKNAPEWVPVARWESLPADGMPQRVPVFEPRCDAWSRLPGDAVSAVFLRRAADSGNVTALSATYQFGCPVEYNVAAERFEAPCWNDIFFDANGQRLHSIPEWGDLRQVRSVLVGKTVYVKLTDTTEGSL